MNEKSYDMVHPQYAVSEVAVFTGMHPQTIRYFDRNGVVVPHRDSRGQRLYSYYDILNLIRRNHYKDMGFSVQETEQLFSGTLTGNLPALLEKKRGQIEQEMRSLEVAKSNLELLSQQLRRLSLCKGRILYMERPACWHIPHSRDGRICSDESSCVSRAMTSSYIYTFSFADGSENAWHDCADWDMTMEPPYAEALGFNSLPGCFFVPGRLCLYTVVEIPGTAFLSRDALRPLYTYAVDNALTPDGTIYGRNILNDFREGELVRYYEAWMPVQDPPSGL